MAASLPLSCSSLLILSFLMLLTFTCSKSIPFSSSSVASAQHEIWWKNVRNNMPNAILSKLSPLSLHESQHITSLATEKSFVFDKNFCSLANLACEANLETSYNRAAGIFYSNGPVKSFSEVDPFTFFRLSVLKQGKKVHLPNLESSWPSRAFLPFQIASKISLNSNELRRLFPRSFVSPVTKDAIEMSLVYCEAPPLKDEIKSCPKSIEEMIEFSKKAVGQKHLLALTSKNTKGSRSELIVGSIKKYDAKKVVFCHEVFLPFSTYYCHLLSSTRLYAVDLLEPEKRVPVNRVAAVCHMDTSEWQEDHVAFKQLKNLSPGKGEACHWFLEGDLAWMNA